MEGRREERRAKGCDEGGREGEKEEKADGRREIRGKGRLWRRKEGVVT